MNSEKGEYKKKKKKLPTVGSPSSPLKEKKKKDSNKLSHDVYISIFMLFWNFYKYIQAYTNEYLDTQKENKCII